jgi:hypothetical protein
MDKLRKTFVLMGVLAFPAAAAHFLAASPDLCFTAGSVTYRLSSDAPSPDYRIAIDNDAPYPDLRVRLVDRVETADFALTDDAGAMVGNACRAAGTLKTIRIVEAGTPADFTIAVSRQPQASDFALYVHSARVSHFDAAALFALVRQAPGRDRVLDAAAGHVASIR